MISYAGSDCTTASVAKGSSPQSGKDERTINTGKVLKSIFVPNIGWASQVKCLTGYIYISEFLYYCNSSCI